MQLCQCLPVCVHMWERLYVYVHEQALKHNGPNYSIKERSSGIN